MALEAFRDVLLQVSGDYARMKIAERENARVRSEKLEDKESDRAYMKGLRDEERAYAKTLREQISQEEIEQIGARAKAIAEAAYAQAPLVADADWATRAAKVGLSYDRAKDKAAQIDAIIKAEAEREAAADYTKALAQKDALLKVEEETRDRTRAAMLADDTFKKGLDAPEIKAAQADLAQAREAIAAVDEAAKTAVLASRKEFEDQFKEQAERIMMSNLPDLVKSQQVNDLATVRATAFRQQLQREENIVTLFQQRKRPDEVIFNNAAQIIGRLGGSFYAPQTPPVEARGYDAASADNGAYLTGAAPIVPAVTPMPAAGVQAVAASGNQNYFSDPNQLAVSTQYDQKLMGAAPPAPPAPPVERMGGQLGMASRAWDWMSSPGVRSEAVNAGKAVGGTLLEVATAVPQAAAYMTGGSYLNNKLRAGAGDAVSAIGSAFNGETTPQSARAFFKEQSVASPTMSESEASEYWAGRNAQLKAREETLKRQQAARSYFSP